MSVNVMRLSNDQKMMLGALLMVKTFSAAVTSHISFQFWVREGDSFLFWFSLIAVIIAVGGTAALVRMYLKGTDFVPYIRRMIGSSAILGAVYCTSLIIWGAYYFPKITSAL